MTEKSTMHVRSILWALTCLMQAFSLRNGFGALALNPRETPLFIPYSFSIVKGRSYCSPASADGAFQDLISFWSSLASRLNTQVAQRSLFLQTDCEAPDKYLKTSSLQSSTVRVSTAELFQDEEAS